MRLGSNLLVGLAGSFAVSVPLVCFAAPEPTTRQMAEPDPQMKAVLDELASFKPKPIEMLTAEEARRQPTATDAVMKLMKDRGMDTTPQPVANVDNRDIPGTAGDINVRVYTPVGNGPFPVIVYYRGGGFVIATLDTYDASCRALTNMVQAVVVSVDYRMAPEHKFPAAHEDAYSALQWVSQHASEINGDPKRIATVGESAGGNLATSVCLMAKDRNGAMPIHEVLIYPFIGNKSDRESILINADARPLNKPMLAWFTEKYEAKPTDVNDKYFSPLDGTKVSDLKGLPPATVITAQIDPLMSEGKEYAEKLKKAGVEVEYKNFDGVTHEFFGMGAVVDKAKDAEMFVSQELKKAFGKPKM